MPAKPHPAVSPQDPAHALLVETYVAAPDTRKHRMVALLIGSLYRQAPMPTRQQLLRHLTRPLGLLSLAVVAGGIFARLRLRSGWPETHPPLDELRRIQSRDVVALADYVQQVSLQAVDGLTQLIAAEPLIAGSTVAAMLVTLLMLRTSNRTTTPDNDAWLD